MNVWINDTLHVTELQPLDTVSGQARWQAAILPYVLIKVDIWEGFTSLAVYNAFDIAGAGHIAKFAIEFKGEKIEFTDFRYLCGFRKTWGQRPSTPDSQKLIGYAPNTEVFDWSEPEIPPMAYGKYITSYTTTGGRPMLGLRECNWVQDKDARIRYANQGLGLPFHIFEPTEPFLPVIKPDYVMGPNTWSVKGDVTKIGMKVDGAHMSSQFLRAALIEKDRIYLDEVVHMGNYATMHYNGTRMVAGQVRKQGRCMTAALFAWNISKNVELEKKIRTALTTYATFKNDITGFAYGRNMDAVKGWYVPYWEYAYMAYALWQAEQFGFMEGKPWLDAFLNYQVKIGTTFPYWMYISSNVPLETLPLQSGMPVGREDSARVVGFIMQQRGLTSPWDLKTLLVDQGMWPEKHALDFKILAPKTEPQISKAKQLWLDLGLAIDELEAGAK